MIQFGSIPAMEQPVPVGHMLVNGIVTRMEPVSSHAVKNGSGAPRAPRVFYYGTYAEKCHLQLQRQLDMRATGAHQHFADSAPVWEKISQFLFRIVKINPFHLFWETSLPVSILAFVQNLFSRKQESITASIARTAARKAEEDRKIFEKKKRLLLPLVLRAKAQIAHATARAIIAQKLREEETLPKNYVRVVSAAQLKAEEAVKAYSGVCQRIWRVRRRAAQEVRAAADEAYLQALDGMCLSHAVPAVRRPRKSLRVVHSLGPLSGLMPYKGLGARNADPICRIFVAMEPLVCKRPDFVQAICTFMMGPKKDLLPLDKVLSLCDNLIHLSEWYPHEALTEELNKLATEADCEEAFDAIAEERQKLDTMLDDYNLKAGEGLTSRVLGKISGLYRRAAKGVSTTFFNGVERVGEVAATGVFKIIMKNFYEALETIKHELGVAKALLDALVEKVKEWFEVILNKASDTLKTLGKYCAYALGLICGVGLCTLTEKVLTGMGISCTGFISTIFCTACFAWMGLELAGGADEVLREMQVHLTCFAKQMFAGACVQKNGLATAEELNAKTIPVVSPIISALGTFGTSLVGFRTSSLVEMGKLAAACHSMRMGKEAIKEFASSVLYYVGRIADKVTGRETIFFDELSLLVQVNVRQWIKNAQGVLLESNYTPLSNMAFSDVVCRLVTDGEKLQAGIAGVPRKMSMDFGQLIGQIMKDLHELHKKIVRCGTSEGRRKEPCWIYIFGASHVGKSNFMDYLASELCKHFDLPHTVCPRNGRDQFFSGYSRQTVLQIDDLSAIKTDPPIEGELINLVSCQEYPLNMADVADKPIYFQSPFIISSSNVIEAPAGIGLRSTEAYRNRRAVLIEMRRKPNAEYSPDDIFAASEIRFFHPESQAIKFGRCGKYGESGELGWMDVPDAMTEILNVATQHRREQDRLQAHYLARYAVRDPVLLAAEEFLSKEAWKHTCFLDQNTCEEAGIPATAGVHYLCVDEEFYTVSATFEFERVIPRRPQYAEWEENCMNTFLNGVIADELVQAKSLIVTGFIRNLVQGDSKVISTEEMSTSATGAQRRLYAKLALGEKVYLRLLQKKVDSQVLENELNVYSNSAWLKLLECVGASKAMVEKHGGSLLLMAGALIAIVVICYGFLKLFVGLMAGSLSLSAALGGVKEVDLKAQYSSGGHDGRYRGKNIPVNIAYSYARSQEGDGLPSAASLCVAIYGTRGHFVSAMQYENKSIMLTRHQAKMFTEGEQLTCIFTSTGEHKLIRWHESEIMEFPQQEIVLWMAPSLPDLPHQFRDLFLKDREVDLPTHFKLVGCVLRKDKEAFHYDTLDTFARVENICLPVKTIINNELYVHEIPRRITFHYAARNHDCGMLILAQIRGKLKVVGLLIAGKDSTSWADILPNPGLGELKAQMEYIPEFGETEEGFLRIGYVEPKDAPTMPTKTNLVRVPPSLQVPTEVEIKEPAIISAKDSRCPEGCVPPLQALRKKFKQPMLELDQGLLDEVSNDIVDTWFDCEENELRDVPVELAINGIPAGLPKEGSPGEYEEEIESFILKTSPGYPYFKENRLNGTKGKEAYFDTKEDGTKTLKKESMAYELYENLVQYTKSEVPELIVLECPKDEPLPARKVKAGACRLFEIMPLHYNLFLRVKTLSFSRFLQKNRDSLPCQVGLNAYSREWSRLFQRLLNKNEKAINCDYSAFDGLMTAQIVECIAKMINRMYAAGDTSEISQKQRFNMIMALHGRKALVGRKLYKINCGIPSGFALTVVINSIFNELLMRYVFKKLAPPLEKNLFSTGVTLLVYGDDNLMSCDRNIATWYNGEAIRMCLKEYNITITDGSDKTAPTIEWKPLSELDFLKRKFLLTESGVVQAPLDLSAIFTSLYWLTPDANKLKPNQKGCDYVGEFDVVEELLLNVNVALVELYLHNDKELFNKVRTFFLQRLPLMKDQIRTWAFCESFHSGQQTGMLRWDPAKVLDAMVGPDFARFMRVSEQGARAHFYAPSLGVCGPFYKPSSDQFVVSTVPLKEHEQGYYIPVTCGIGIGGLPTVKWVQDFARSSRLRDDNGFLCRDAILSAYRSGKTLIFKDKAPYVAGNAALISFASSAKLIDQKDALHLYRNVIPEATDGLERYFDAPIAAAQLPGKFYFANGETYSHLHDFKEADVCSFEGGVREVLNDASRQRMIPCLSAAQLPKGKCAVALVCEHKTCPHHYVTSTSFKGAFEQCWLSRCKTAGNQVGHGFGLKKGATRW